MNGITFEDVYDERPTPPNRVDIACFVGFVRRRSGADGAFTAVPPRIAGWLAANAWVRGDVARSELADVPVPVTDWNTFASLFEWEARTHGVPGDGSTYLGAAVRAFFAEGGAKCYVVRVGDPSPLARPAAARARAIAIEGALARLVPGYPQGTTASAVDRSTWRGVALLHGLEDVSFVAMPDLADIVAAPSPPVDEVRIVSQAKEVFVECSTGDAPPPTSVAAPALGAPRCDAAGYVAWARAIGRVLDLLRGEPRLREVQLVAAVPIPTIDAATSSSAGAVHALDDLPAFFRSIGVFAGGPPQPEDVAVDSAFLQLVYPWLRTSGSDTLPEQIAPGEGTLIGLIARSALARGTYRSVAGQQPVDVSELRPELGRDQLGVGAPDATFAQRVSVFGPTPAGFALASDVTTSSDPEYRPACVGRLMASVLGAARRLGQEITFEPAGPRVLQAVERQLSRVMLALWTDGALSGATPSDAFDVRCDATTTTADDLDLGRVLAEVRMQPALPVDAIHVVLSVAGDAAVARGLAAGAPS